MPMSPISPDIKPQFNSRDFGKRALLSLGLVFGAATVLTACENAVNTQEAQLSPAPAEVYPMLSQTDLFTERPSLADDFERWTNTVKQQFPAFQDSELHAFGIDFPGQDNLEPAAFFQGRNEATNNYVLSYVKGNEVIGLELRETLWADGNTYQAFGYLEDISETESKFRPVLVFRVRDVIFISEVGGQQPLIGAIGQTRDVLLSNSNIVQATMTAAAETPTETPTDHMLEASQNLPEGSGSLTKEGEQWIFNSPDGVEAGKNVPVTTLEHANADGSTENWIALVDHPEWPLFVQTETGELQTALEYVDVKRPLVDAEGNPIPLACKDDGKNVTEYYANCFFVVRGELFQEGEIVYIPVAIPSTNGSYDSPMIPIDIPVHPDGANKDEYPNRVYNPISVAFTANRNSIVSLLKTGDVFWLQFSYDDEKLDSKIADRSAQGKELWAEFLQNKKDNREQIRYFLKFVTTGQLDSFVPMEKLQLWGGFDFGIGTSN